METRQPQEKRSDEKRWKKAQTRTRSVMFAVLAVVWSGCLIVVICGIAALARSSNVSRDGMSADRNELVVVTEPTATENLTAAVLEETSPTTAAITTEPVTTTAEAGIASVYAGGFRRHGKPGLCRI